MKQLIVDTLDFNISPELVNESINSGGRLIVKGPIQKAETKNGNGRVYSRDLLEREFKAYKEGPIRENRATGELDHPDSAVINLKNVSHIIRDIWWDGDTVMGKIEILTTPSGNILKELIKCGVKLGVSSRGMGSVKQIGETVEVQDDFELLCIDFVSTPSTPGAYMSALNESVDPNIKKPSNEYENINNIITEILCNRMGFCPCELPS